MFVYVCVQQTPFAKFCCGNEKTLKRDPKEKGVDIYSQLRTFHNLYYIASNMRLVVVGYDTLDCLQDLVTRMFANVRDSTAVVGGAKAPVIAPELSSVGAPWRIGNRLVAKQMEKLGIYKTSDSESKLIEGQRWIFLVTFLNIFKNLK